MGLEGREEESMGLERGVGRGGGLVRLSGVGSGKGRK